jgi:hypothetical protein
VALDWQSAEDVMAVICFSSTLCMLTALLQKLTAESLRLQKFQIFLGRS